MSLRWRIAAGLAVIAAFVSALAATGSYLSTSRQLKDSIDQTLLSRTESLNHAEPGGRKPSPGPPDQGSECPPPGTLQPAAAAQLVAADGTVTICMQGGPKLAVDARDRALARDGGAARLRSVTVSGERYRVLTFAWHDGGALQTARGLGEIDSVLSSLRLRLLGLGSVGVIAAALLGWLFARRLVRPVDQLRDAAERIARTQDLTASVPTQAGGEIGSLARSFTTMVDALATSRRQQQQLITDASHELRTPLTSLQTNAELLGRARQLDADQQRVVVDGIRLEVGELTNLVSEIVELATDQSGDTEEPEPTRLGDLARAVAQRAHQRTGRTVDVLEDQAVATMAQPHMLERAISNLVDNALKYSPRDSAVEIVVNGTRVEVLDRGPGIPPDDQPHVFDRFYRSIAARTEPGSGLGLAIVKQIVELHDGATSVADRPGGGAAVGFELPRR